MTTRIIPAADDSAVANAIEALIAGEVVGLPTETVYGLAADAFNVEAVLKIFETKDRPRFDPLIVHLPEIAFLDEVADISRLETKLVFALIERFWPGPLTLVLPRRTVVSDVVTAGLDTVAVRVSAHPIFERIVQGFGRPLAAPSANRFGRITPTNAEHVLAELDGRIALIVDGGPTMHGLESTIIAPRGGRIEILRPGPITEEQLSAFAEIGEAAVRDRPEAPGQLPSHYAPRTPFFLTEDLDAFAPDPGKKTGALCWTSAAEHGFAEKRVLSAKGDLREAAANLFRYLRELDEAGLDLIVAEKLPETGLGRAIMDRLRRAAATLGARDRPG